MTNSTPIDFTIQTLGPCKISSPLHMSVQTEDYLANFVTDDHLVIYNAEIKPGETMGPFTRDQLLEKAGPREKIYFDPTKVHAGIITCGGLCPGLNDVIRELVNCLWYRYGVKRISGIRFGYRGFLPEYGYPAMELEPNIVSDIHHHGGSILGSSRGGGERVTEIVDAMARMNINMLFTIGGDGTQRGSLKIFEEAQKQGLRLSVIGVPKTIDNDLSFIQKSFGFDTAVSEAVNAVSGAHVEAHDAINGIGLVKVMGRESGFIAAHTALALNDVNYVLIPEVSFDLHGEKGLLASLKKRLISRNHAVIVVAEGAGQELIPAAITGTDASGNKKLGDIGVFLSNAIKDYFAAEKMELNLKYIDPSYMLRSVKANPADALYCARLAASAVHAAMAGKTGALVSMVNDHLVHIPIQMAVSQRNRVDPERSLWRDVIDATGMPALMKNQG